MKNFLFNNKNINTITDLHSHLLGVLPAEKLINIGLKHNLEIPVEHLNSMGLDVSNVNVINNNVYLKQIIEVFGDSYVDFLTFSTYNKNTEVDTFNILLKNYFYRSVYFKTSEMLIDILYETALFYKSMGVKYVELTTKWFYKDYFLNVINTLIPKIEKEIGVKIRFLASIDRGYSVEKLKEYTANAINLINHPYIVGVDFLGNEIESVEKLKDFIELIVEAVVNKNNRYCIRIHSGEKNTFINNTIDILNIIKDKKLQLEKQNLKTYKMPYIRIGHAIYGFSNKCINMCKEMGVIIEINSTSNIKLNNVNNANQIPLKKYLDANLKVVLGTDSPGIFETTTINEVNLAKQMGVTNKELKNIVKLEKFIIKKYAN